MDRVKYFKRKVKELALLTDIEVDIVVRRDNRMGKYTACISLYLYCDNGEHVYLLRYNTKMLKKCSKAEMINLILHELGHIKLQHELSKLPLEQMEYEAEKFAIINIKKYFPKFYPILLGYLRAYEEHHNCVYQKAFGKLVKEIDEKRI